MPEWIKLYKGKSIKDLKKFAEKGLNKEKLTQYILIQDGTSRIIKVMDKCIENYKTNKEKGDQEQCYIFLYKFSELFAFLQVHTKKNGGVDQKYIAGYFGNKIGKVLDDLEDLDEQLRIRYDKLKERDNIKCNGTSIKPEPDEILTQKKTKAYDDCEDKIKLSTGDDKLSKNDIFISCKELKELIESSNPLAVLIMDVRTEEEYKSRVKSDNNINIPMNIIRDGSSAVMLENQLPKESLNLWNRRGEFEIIVLMDRNTNAYRFKPGTAIFHMREILMKWDFPLQCKKTFVLNDGFTAWDEMFPNYTINSGLQKIFNSSSAKPATVSISEIQYPDSDDEHKLPNKIIQPASNNIDKPVISVPTPAIPHFDRSSKPKQEKNNIVDSNTTQKILRSITESPPANDISDNEESIKNNVMSDDRKDSTRTVPPTHTYPSDVNSKPTNQENYKLTNGEHLSTRDNQKNDSEIKYVGLKSDSSSASSPGLKKSLSSPNISKLADNTEVLLPKTIPIFDRSNKPSHLSLILPRNRYQDKFRGLSLGELEGAVMGANIAPGLTGLKNLGNTCYMNSILQCISNTTELREELCKFSVDSRNHKSKTEGLIAREIKRVIQTLWLGNVKYFPCRDLKTAIGKFRNSFKGSEQQDSHEFFTILMDWLHEDLNEPSPSGDLLGAVEETGEKAWGEFRKNNHSIVLDLFYGQQKSTVECNECKKQSVTFEPFSNLSLLLPNSEDSCTLNGCLELYLKKECISGWNCPKCKTPQNATKKVDITRLPPVLVIHFKRFTSNGWCRKKQTYVEFPVTNFDMKKYTPKNSEQRNEVYSLYAVSNHYGTMESGHYTAFCLNTESNKWFKFDDQDVSEISQNDVKTSAAYILFYSVKR